MVNFDVISVTAADNAAWLASRDAVVVATDTAACFSSAALRRACSSASAASDCWRAVATRAAVAAVDGRDDAEQRPAARHLPALAPDPPRPLSLQLGCFLSFISHSFLISYKLISSRKEATQMGWTGALSPSPHLGKE